MKHLEYYLYVNEPWIYLESDMIQFQVIKFKECYILCSSFCLKWPIKYYVEVLFLCRRLKKNELSLQYLKAILYSYNVDLYWCCVSKSQIVNYFDIFQLRAYHIIIIMKKWFLKLGRYLFNVVERTQNDTS